MHADYKEHVSFQIDEASIANGKATINVSLPDLSKIYDEIASNYESPSPQEENRIIEELQKNLGQHTEQKTVEAEVEQINGTWKIKSYESISACVDQSFDDFIMEQLLQIDFSGFEVGVAS